jgi:hypothetical protein
MAGVDRRRRDRLAQSDLAAVLAEGNDAGETGITNLGSTTVLVPGTDDALRVEHTVAGGATGAEALLSLVGANGVEVLRVTLSSAILYHLQSGQPLRLSHAVDDVENTFDPLDIGESNITINLSDFFGTEFTIRSRGSSSRKLLSAGYNDSGEIILGFSAGRVGFFGTTGVTRPEVPASPSAQDVVTALKALGLITQAV